MRVVRACALTQIQDEATIIRYLPRLMPGDFTLREDDPSPGRLPRRPFLLHSRLVELRFSFALLNSCL